MHWRIPIYKREASLENIFDVSVTLRRWYNNINNQLDATMTVY